MQKGYWVVSYTAISDDAALQRYGEVAIDVIQKAGGNVLVRAAAARTVELGKQDRTVVVEFPSLAIAEQTYDSPSYQDALRILGAGAERDFRIFEGT